jgi:hypothetical protein
VSIERDLLNLSLDGGEVVCTRVRVLELNGAYDLRVVGDPEAGFYEWVLIKHPFIESHSNHSYGDYTIAIMEGLKFFHSEHQELIKSKFSINRLESLKQEKSISSFAGKVTSLFYQTESELEFIKLFYNEISCDEASLLWHSLSDLLKSENALRGINDKPETD